MRSNYSVESFLDVVALLRSAGSGCDDFQGAAATADASGRDPRVKGDKPNLMPNSQAEEIDVCELS